MADRMSVLIGQQPGGELAKFRSVAQSRNLGCATTRVRPERLWGGLPGSYFCDRIEGKPREMVKRKCNAK
jgi:hypothetical protein